MKNIGLDFGTTNSAISYVDPKQKTLDCYRMRNADSNYIPSFVGFEKEDSTIEIGRSARLNQGDDDYYVFSKFKMLLDETNKARLEQLGYIDKTPYECAKNYIQELLNNYQKEKHNNNKIEKLVITVPEIWIKEHRHQSREYIKKICTELNLPLKKLISEPVAASVYFVHSYNQQYESWFNGHVLVCDYGGGTLDLSLAKVEGQKITVLECTGKGQDEQLIGKAGVAFDHEVATKVYERVRNENLSRNNPNYLKIIQDFEEKKIFQKQSIDKKLTSYLKNAAIDKKIFKLLDDMECKPSDLVNAFNHIIKPDLMNALGEMKKYLIKHDVQLDNSDQFRIVMAGGFSSFFLVQKTIKDFFGSETDSDKRFESCFDIEEISLAIAKGAALIANDMFNIDLICPISVGLRVKALDSKGFIQEKDIPVLEKGTPLSQYKHPVFLKGGMTVNIDPSMRETPVILLLGDADDRRYINLDKRLDQFFANIHKANKWKVGFSVNEDYLFSLHTEDKNGHKRDTQLGDLLQKVSGLIYNEETK
jgi:molecular chaperone DnaK